MKLTKIKRKELKRGDMFCDANGMLDRPVMMLFIDKHTHHYDPNAEVYRIDAPELKEARIDTTKDIAELTTRLEECRHAKQVLQEFIDTLNIKIANRDNKCEANATDLELLDAMLEIVNPIIRSGEYSHPAQSSGFLSRRMNELCHRVNMFRRKHNIVE